MHRKNTAREPAEPTLQRAHNARRVKAQHDLSTTKLTLQKHLLQTAKRGYADTRDA